MNKEFVPYEQALELKELGFDEECFAYYNISEKITLKSCFNRTPIILSGKKCSIPLYSQVFRWFREKHNINTVISWRDDLLNYDISLTEMKKYGYFYYKQNYNTYEEAELECLKKLIEIVKK